MPSDEEVAKFMLETAEWKGGMEARQNSLENILTRIDRNVATLTDRVSMARGGWIATMAVIGLIVSAAGVVLAAARLWQGRGF